MLHPSNQINEIEIRNVFDALNGKIKVNLPPLQALPSLSANPIQYSYLPLFVSLFLSLPLFLTIKYKIFESHTHTQKNTILIT